MIFSAENICKTYNGRKIVNNIDVSFSTNKVIGILGPNGAGKTTLFSILVGLVAPDRGNIFLDEEDITSLPVYKRARKGIVYLPQDCSIFSGLNVEDNIRSILELHTSNNIDLILNHLLNSFSLSHLRKAKAISLSGGEKRKVEIARALAANPKFLLLDEPFSGIDPISITEISAIIKKLNAMQIGIIITDHNVRETLQVLDNVYIVADGRILMHGTPKEIVAHEDVQRIYLGSNFNV